MLTSVVLDSQFFSDILYDLVDLNVKDFALINKILPLFNTKNPKTVRQEESDFFRYCEKEVSADVMDNNSEVVQSNGQICNQKETNTISVNSGRTQPKTILLNKRLPSLL